MHRCLAIPEIVTIICEFILEGNICLRPRDVLGRLALCCKALNGPATAALWKQLPSIVPLLKALPPQTFKEDAYRSRFVSSSSRVNSTMFQ